MMERLKPNERKLVGVWQTIGNQVVGDDICDRIEQLTENYLEQVAADSSGWDILYKDPGDGRYWELIYPQSHLHGGGPPTLECISESLIREKYGVDISNKE